MNVSLKTVVLFSLVVIVAYAPTFLLAGSIDGDEWIKSGAGAMGIALVALFGKMAGGPQQEKKSNSEHDY